MAAFHKIPFTASAYQKMQSDLAEMILEEPKIVERLKTAREMGDLSENGAYRYAKLELGNLRGKMKHLRRLLQFGEVVEKVENSSTVGFGNSVTLLAPNGKIFVYMIVSKHESNPQEKKLSRESPIGHAVFGRRVGDTVKVEIPAGLAQYQITHIG